MRIGVRASSVRNRRLLLGGGLVLTLLAVRWVDSGAADTVASPAPTSAAAAGAPVRAERPQDAAGQAPASSPRPVARPASPSTATTIAIGRLDRPRALPQPAANPFDTAPWTPESVAAAESVARSKRAQAEPPPPPMAPPLPFTFVGRLIDGDRSKVFLNQGTRTLIVGAGETFDSVYRVERIEDDSVHFTYLPLDQQQVLAIPGSQR
jgi:hypothetical protein